MGFNPEDEKAEIPVDVDIDAQLDTVADEAVKEPVSDATLNIDDYMNDDQPVTDAPLYKLDDLGLTRQATTILDDLDIPDEPEVDETLMDLEQYRKHYRKNNAGSAGGRSNSGNGRSNSKKSQKGKKKNKYIVPVIALIVLLLIGGATIFFAKTLKDSITDSSSGENTTPVASSVSVVEEEPEEEEVKGDPYYVTGCKEGGTEKVYEQADNKSPVITELENGAEVRATETEPASSFMKVYLEEEKLTGYVRKSKLVSNPAFVATQIPYYVNVEENEKVALLESVSAGSEKIGSLTTNKKVALIAKASVKYWYVYSSDLKSFGYIDKDLISKKKIKTKAQVEKEKAAALKKKQEEAKKNTLKQEAEKTEQQKEETQSNAPANYETYYVSGVTNYLALRSEQAFDKANEIGGMKNGVEIHVIEKQGDYWYVYVPCIDKKGYVNSEYLSTSPNGNTSSNNSGSTSKPKKNIYYASVEKNYLALRNAKSFEKENEIGKIYDGEKVEVLDSSTGKYWYVYVPSLDKKGYVNSEYLTK